MSCCAVAAMINWWSGMVDGYFSFANFKFIEVVVSGLLWYKQLDFSLTSKEDWEEIHVCVICQFSSCRILPLLIQCKYKGRLHLCFYYLYNIYKYIFALQCIPSSEVRQSYFWLCCVFFVFCFKSKTQRDWNIRNILPSNFNATWNKTVSFVIKSLPWFSVSVTLESDRWI